MGFVLLAFVHMPHGDYSDTVAFCQRRERRKNRANISIVARVLLSAEVRGERIDDDKPHVADAGYCRLKVWQIRSERERPFSVWLSDRLKHVNAGGIAALPI